MKETADEIIRLSSSRDNRCALSLRVTSLTELGAQFVPDPNAHFLVTLIGDCAKCKVCVNSSLCRCLRDHFQSTTNSKRRVSTYLFWKNKLGLAFPVSDEMLERNVWMNLESCDHGIKRGNGQRKQKKGPICVNPYHYYPADAYAVLTPLSTTLGILGLTSDKIIHQTLTHMGWNGANFQPAPNAEASLGLKGFELICARLRQMSEEAVAAVDNPYDTPVASPATQTQQVQQYVQAQSPDAGMVQPQASSVTYTPEHSPQYSSEFNGQMPPEYLVPAQQQPPQAGAHQAEEHDYDFDFDFDLDEGDMAKHAASSMLDDVHNQQFSTQQLNDLSALEQALTQQEAMVAAGQTDAIPSLPTVMGLNQEELSQLLSAPDPGMQDWGTANFNTQAQPDTNGMAMGMDMSSFEFQWNGNPAPIFQSAAGAEVEEVDPSKKVYEIADDCQTGNIVVMKKTKHTIKIENMSPENIDSAGHVGVLRHEKGEKKHVCVMGTIDVRVTGPTKPGDLLYADLGAGGATATASVPSERKIVVGKVLAAGPEAMEATTDQEHLVSCVVSLSAPAGKQDLQRALVRAARLRSQLKKNKKPAAGTGSSDDAGATKEGAASDDLANKMGAMAVNEKKVQRFQKIGSAIADESAVCLFSHKSSQALRMEMDGNVDASGQLNSAALLVVVRAKDGMVRLQSSLDDELWLNTTGEAGVDAKGNPDKDETLFKFVEHADGRFSITSGAGSTLTVGESGAVTASVTKYDDAAYPDEALFTAYRRVMPGN